MGEISIDSLAPKNENGANNLRRQAIAATRKTRLHSLLEQIAGYCGTHGAGYVMPPSQEPIRRESRIV